MRSSISKPDIDFYHMAIECEKCTLYVLNSRNMLFVRQPEALHRETE